MFSTLFVCEGGGLFLVALLLHCLFILEAEPHHQLGSIVCNVAYTYILVWKLVRVNDIATNEGEGW